MTVMCYRHHAPVHFCHCKQPYFGPKDAVVKPAAEPTLSTRIEAGQPSRELFLEAWAAVKGSPLAGSVIIKPMEWAKQTNRFTDLLDAEAWTSAAEMLVPPEGFVELNIYQGHTDDGMDNAIVWPVYGEQRCYFGDASHPATALLAAVVRSTEEKNP